uniref:Uncharacterized protein n=1 Tax=Clytia hemisphaerica TaxID=252671 RepID=A0A7M5V7E1_9CNID
NEIGRKINTVEDGFDLEKAVLGAKNDDWEASLALIARKPYLVNCIPEKRSWSILHQAIYWNNSKIVEKLLAMYTCDIFVKTKKDTESAPAGMSGLELAKYLENRGDVRKLIENYDMTLRKERLDNAISFVTTSSTGSGFMSEGLPLFYKIVTSFKNSMIVPAESPEKHLQMLLSKINDQMLMKRLERYFQVSVRYALYH